MENKITYLLSKIDTIEIEEMNTHFLNYICVLISGYLEKELQEIIENYKQSEHCRMHECKDTIKSMRKIQNAKWCSIRPIIMNIDEIILIQLKNDLDNVDDIINSIDNMVKTRHKIAHGDNVVNLTKIILQDDFRNIKSFIQKLKDIFGNIC